MGQQVGRAFNFLILQKILAGRGQIYPKFSLESPAPAEGARSSLAQKPPSAPRTKETSSALPPHPSTGSSSGGCLGWGLFRGLLHETGGKGESSGPCWDQASFFFLTCCWMDEAPGAEQPPPSQHLVQPRRWGGTGQDGGVRELTPALCSGGFRSHAAHHSAV